MNEKNKITGEEAAKAIHQLNKSVKMSNILLDYLYAYQGGDPDPSIGSLFNGYKKLDLAAQGYGICLNADIRHQVIKYMH